MSIIFGLLKEQGALVSEEEMESMALSTQRYATGAGAVYWNGRLGLGFQPYLSHERSKMDTGPIADPGHCALCFDGRLDNYEELAEILGLESSHVSDSEIVLSAFLRWDERCFERLVGDWALALWSETKRALYLARDHAGSRTLYYQQQRNQALWSTHLDTFLATSADSAQLSEDFVACYLAGCPIRNLTPYEGIRSVKPAHYLRIHDGAAHERVHWDPVSAPAIHYQRDSEYEDHFLHLLEQAVERRTGPGEPILAQLSGGMDSTSIVCMSDHLRRMADPDAEILDTVSFYDDSEASLNEKAYFSITEAMRGKIGIHIDVAFSQRTFEPYDAHVHAYLFPGADSLSARQEHSFYDRVWSRGYRSILSGIGGDELLGGVPVALPELAHYLAAGDFSGLLRQAVAWSLVDRSPLLGTLYDTIKFTIELYGISGFHNTKVPPWMSSDLRKRLRAIDSKTATLLTRIGAAPDRLDNWNTWWAVMETPPHLTPQTLARPEYRYPLLDRDLVNFLFSIPREQVLRPGCRRSLMRRALRGIVPSEILERRRKAFQSRAPLNALRQAQSKLESLFSDPVVAGAGYIALDPLRDEIGRVTQGEAEWVQALLKTIALELWLRSSSEAGNLRSSETTTLHLGLTA